MEGTLNAPHPSIERKRIKRTHYNYAPGGYRPGGSVASRVGGQTFVFGCDTQEALATEAHRRGISQGRLIGNLLDRIVEDGLIDAVLDE